MYINSLESLGYKIFRQRNQIMLWSDQLQSVYYIYTHFVVVKLITLFI